MRSRVSALGWALALGCVSSTLVSITACNGREQLPPLPEVLVVVDTDLPVPLVASRLRVDLYGEDGAWFDSNDIARPSPSEWPASFSVYSEDESRSRNVWVRLRAYPEGRQTDYRGERFRGWDAPFAEPAGDGNPRLVKSGVDVTPQNEPPHLLTVDRLVLVSLVPGKKGKVSIVLRGACVGTMSRLDDRGLPGPGAETCIDTAKTLVPVAATPASDALSRTEPTLVGSFERDPCRPEETTEDRVCIDGGATLFGTNAVTEYAPGVSRTAPPTPARVFALKKYYVDRNEVTVGEFRTKVGARYTGPLPAPNEGPLRPSDTTDPNAKCTWSDVKRDREGYPLNCIDWDAAQRYCRLKGGDLPTEVQWEHLTTVASRSTKTRYPSGDVPPACDDVVYARSVGGVEGADCTRLGLGPQVYTSSANDVSPSGVVALGGSLSEWAIGTPDPYSSACWRDAPLVDPTCLTGSDNNRVIRGANWATPPVRGTFRFFNDYLDAGAAVGFRCVYPPGAP